MTNKILIWILEFRFWISTWFSGMRALIAIWYFVFRDKDCCQNGRMEYNEEIAATISIRAVDWRGGKQTNVCWMLVYLVLIKHEIIYIVSARCSYISYLPLSLCDLLGGGKIENMFLLTIPSHSHSLRRSFIGNKFYEKENLSHQFWPRLRLSTLKGSSDCWLIYLTVLCKIFQTNLDLEFVLG